LQGFWLFDRLYTFKHRATPCAGVLRPCRAFGCYIVHTQGLHPVLVYCPWQGDVFQIGAAWVPTRLEEIIVEAIARPG